MYLGLHLFAFVALLILALATALGHGPIAIGDSGLKGHRLWFVGAVTLTLAYPLVVWILSRIKNPAFARFALFVILTLVLQIVVEVFFIQVFFKNMVNPVAVTFIALRCWILFRGLSRFPGATERAFLATNLIFWLLNVSQQLIWSSPRILL